MQKSDTQMQEKFVFFQKRTQENYSFHQGDFDFSIIFFSAKPSYEETVTADSMECYAAPWRRLWESMKLVHLVFVLNNINLNTLLV